MAIAVERPRRVPLTNGGRPRGLVESRRYRLVARRLPATDLRRVLNVTRRDLERLLSGRVRFLTHAQARKIERLVSARTAAWLRESERYDALVAGEVPVGLVAPVIVAGFARYGRDATAEMVGLPTRTLFRILNDANSVSFLLADKLVVGLHGPGWWREEHERMGWYFSAEARLRNQRRQV